MKKAKGTRLKQLKGQKKLKMSQAKGTTSKKLKGQDEKAKGTR